jgi:hypothetical protein
MARRIAGGRAAGGAPEGAAAPPDDYLGRLVKYVPAETVGAYLAAAASVPPGRTAALWVVFAASWILTPLYLWFATSRRSKRPLVSQIALATIAFPIWVFAIGGPFAELPWYAANRYVASILLIFATTGFALYQPLEDG